MCDFIKKNHITNITYITTFKEVSERLTFFNITYITHILRVCDFSIFLDIFYITFIMYNSRFCQAQLQL